LADAQTGYEATPPVRVEAAPICDDNASAIRIKTHIYDDKLFEAVEQDLYKLDLFFKSKDIFVLITFDQLDKVVKPNLWSRAISPLIRYSQSQKFTRILP